MSRQMTRVLAALPLFSLFLIAAPSFSQDWVDSQRQVLVEEAISNDQPDSAIAALHGLYELTGDIAVRSDLIALLVRAQRFDEALAVCPECSPEDYTDSELLSLAGAARSEGNSELALSLFSSLSYRAPEEPAAWLGQALAHTDLGNIVLAESALKRYETLAGASSAGLEAEGYLAAETDNLTRELQARQALVERQPGQPSEVRALFRLAVRLGASEPARELIEQYPDLFNEIDSHWLLYYEGLNAIRLGVHIDDHRMVEEGLDQLNRVLATEELNPDLRFIAESDKVVALTQLRRFAEAEALSQRLLHQSGSLPSYVLRARANALSGLGRPEQAIELYHEILSNEPGRGADLDDPLYEGLFYSYTDARQHQEAQQLLQAWRRIEPPYRHDFTGTTQIENPNRQKVLLLETMLLAWRGKEREAYAQADSYLAEAPANPYLWLLRGDISRWRGWPEQAQEDYRQAASLLSPEQRDIARHGELLARLQQGNWRGTVEQIREELVEAKPSVSRDNLQREWQEQRAAELAITLERSDGQGGGTQASKEWLSDVIFRSPRNDSGSRYYLQHRHQHGTFDTGSLRAGYAIAGYEWNRYPSQFTFAAGHGLQLNDEPHFSSTLQYDFTDHLAVTLGAEYNSLTTPLRALDDDVNANRYHAGLIYRQHERRTLGAGVSFTDFDDSNLRRSAYGYWQERLYHHDRWLLTGTAYASGSLNDDVDASYYNPERDIHLGGELTLEYAYPLGYRQTFTQGITLGAGHYWQKDESNDETWRLGYQHRWEFIPTISLEYGIARERTVYDGRAEYDTVVTGALVWRFL